MPTTSNFGWTTPADTDLVKDGALAIRTLGNGIDTSFLDLKGGTTGQNLRKASNTDLDFTFAGDATNTVIDAEGDLLVGDSADTLQRLAIGTTGQVLTVDTTLDGKVKWAAPAGGGKVLQVVEGTTETTVTDTTGSMVDSGLSATITPSATTSKILVIVMQQGGHTGNRSASFRLVRSSTNIAYAIYQWDNSANADFQAATVGFTKLDSPSTTSAITYKTQFCRGGSSGSATAQTFGASQSTSVMILMEIGA